jgi:sigma-B regulation protein RsbU (phosphoserine phosphatase)
MVILLLRLISKPAMNFRRWVQSLIPYKIGPKLKEHEKMQSSLQIAREIQQRLLPKEAPNLKNFELAGFCKYSDETGGDYYDYVSFDEIEPGKVSVILGDVTGHGIGAALLMASARSMLRNNIRQYAYDLSRILFEFNNDLAVDTDPDKFITLFYGLIDDDNVEIKWATGGHDPAILITNENKDVQELKGEGVPMGFMPDMAFEQAGPKKLQKGDVIVVGTDGIWEAEDKSEEMFGKDRMVEVIKNNSNKSAADIAQSVIDAVLSFTHPVHQEDDITIVVIKVK